MSPTACSHEPAVIEAVRNSALPSSLKAHVADCVACAQAVRVTRWMGGVATALGRDRPLPDPAYLWLKAEIERRARDAHAISARGLGSSALASLSLGLIGAAATLVLLSEATATAGVVRAWLTGALAEGSMIDLTVIGTAWLGLPLILAVTYLLVLRPQR